MNTATDTTTDTDERTELLRQWAELEPDRCERMGLEYLLTVRDHGFHVWPNDAPVNQAALQYAVQEAIRARGWDWRLEGYGGHYYANVDRPFSDSPGVPQVVTQEGADVALLAAWIKALRDEAETED